MEDECTLLLIRKRLDPSTMYMSNFAAVCFKTKGVNITLLFLVDSTLYMDSRCLATYTVVSWKKAKLQKAMMHIVIIV